MPALAVLSVHAHAAKRAPLQKLSYVGQHMAHTSYVLLPHGVPELLMCAWGRACVCVCAVPASRHHK